MLNQNRPVVGVGVDLCDISRIERAIEKEHFVSRIYSEAEWAYIQKKGMSRAQSAAAIYAAKEAVVKALGTGIAKGVFLDQVEVTHDELGAPGVLLSGAACARMAEIGGQKALISLSHEGNMAIAFCMIVA